MNLSNVARLLGPTFLTVVGAAVLSSKLFSGFVEKKLIFTVHATTITHHVILFDYNCYLLGHA